MKIKTQFIITMALFGVLLIGMAASLMITYRQAGRLYTQAEIAHNIERAARELSYLSNDYLLHRESQQRARWEAKFSELSEHLSRLNSDSPDQRVFAGQIKANQGHLKSVFEEVVATLEGGSQTWDLKTELAFMQVSWSRMEVQNQGTIFDAALLAQDFYDKIDRLKQANIVLIFILVGIFGIYFLVNYYLIYRRTLRGLSNLQAGMEIVGTGDLACRFDDLRPDEIGELARAFNRMATNLREVTASKADLEREVNERERAEDRTRWQNAVLSSINQIFQEALACRSEEELGRMCLTIAEAVTQSKFGFVGLVNEQTGQLDEIAISHPGWEDCQAADQPARSQAVPVGFEIHSMYGRVLQDGKGFYSNPPASPDSITIPAGHPAVQSFLGVPLIHAGKTIGLLGLANREGGYGPREWEAAEALALAILQAFMSKRAEEALRRSEISMRHYAEKLETSNRELQEFAYVASHDLKEPLRKIDGFGRILQAGSENLDELQRDALERMRQASRRMQRMVDGLLALSQVTTQGRPFGPVDLSQVAGEVLSDLEMQIRRTRGEVELRDLPVVESDLLQMRQLLQNLIGNALKYHKPEVAPLVTVSGKTLSATKVQILVEDNGIGFDESSVERIFQPFQRLVGRNEYEGSGMGLAICRKIVERHGGEITAKSKPGYGSTFIVTLPSKAGLQ